MCYNELIMNKKKAPYIFLLVLFIILVFVVGIRYGQRVERANRTIDYLKKYLPTQEPTPEVDFVSITHEECGILFLAPKNLKVIKTKTGLTANESEKTVISIQCLARSATGKKPEENIATESVRFANEDIVAKVIKRDGITLYNITLNHPKNGKIVSIFVKKNLFPLFEKTFSFFIPTPTSAASSQSGTTKQSAAQ